jgi:hypothetical protein
MIILSLGTYNYLGAKLFEVCFFVGKRSRNIQVQMIKNMTSLSEKYVISLRENYRGSSPLRELKINKTY